MMKRAAPSDRAEAATTARQHIQFAKDAAKTVAPYVQPTLTAIALPEPGQQIAPLPPLARVVQFAASDPRIKPRPVPVLGLSLSTLIHLFMLLQRFLVANL
jgi:hypothetical protein